MSDEMHEIPDRLPLFPLPGMVLFPHTIIPLHIFEPRYREMLADTLEGDKALGIALLKPGFEPLYYTRRAPIHEIIGVGEILKSEHLPDDNYNLLLRGVGRAVILDEEAVDKPYRVARVEPLDTYCTGDDDAADALRSALFEAIRDNPAIDASARKQWLRLSDASLELDIITDVLAAGLPAEAELRQCLLAEPDAVPRGQMLLEQMKTLAAIAHNIRRREPKRHELN